jgi:cholesterol transport system auxiliary component
MANYNKILIIIFTGISLFLTACLDLKQPRNKIEYYTLEYDPPSAGDRQILPWAIRVAQFSVSPVYNSNRIVYRDKAFKRQTYAYYMWRANPGDLVSYFLSRDMKHSGLFKAVLTQGSNLPTSYLVEGSVDEFYELDEKNAWKAVLSVSVAVMDETELDLSKKILFQKIYRSTRPCHQKNPRALAQAMSQAMLEVSEKIINDSYDYMASKIETNLQGFCP